MVISGLYVVCAALRLARFNVQTGSTDKRRFTGLPVPGAAVMIAGCVLAYSYFELSSPRVLCAVMAPLTLALAALMISRVPYPSFKSIHPRKRAQFEMMAGVLVVAAMFLAMPQFTSFILAIAYVLRDRFCFARGERIQKLPFLHPLEAGRRECTRNDPRAMIGARSPATESPRLTKRRLHDDLASLTAVRKSRLV